MTLAALISKRQGSWEAPSSTDPTCVWARRAGHAQNLRSRTGQPRLESRFATRPCRATQHSPAFVGRWNALIGPAVYVTSGRGIDT